MGKINVGDSLDIMQGDVAIADNIVKYTTTLQYLGTDTDENNIYKVSVNLNKKVDTSPTFYIEYMWNDGSYPYELDNVVLTVPIGKDSQYTIIISSEPIRDIGLMINSVNCTESYINENNYIILTPYIIKFRYELIYMGRYSDSLDNQYKLNIIFDEELPCPLAFNLSFAGEHNETINGFSNIDIVFQEGDITKSIIITSTEPNDPSKYGNIKLIENSYGNPYMISVEHKENESKFIYGIRLEITNTFIKCAGSTPNRDITAGYFKYDIHPIDVPDCDVNIFLHVNGYSADYWLIDNAYLSEDYSLYPEIPYDEIESLKNITKDNFELDFQSAINDKYLPYTIEKYVSNIPDEIQKDFTINLYISEIATGKYTLELDIKNDNTIDFPKYVYLYMTNQDNQDLYEGFLILDGETTVKGFTGNTAIFKFTTDSFSEDNELIINQIYICSYSSFDTICYDYVIDSAHSNITNTTNSLQTNDTNLTITPKFGVNNKEVTVSGPVYNYPKDIIYPFKITTAKDKVASFNIKLKAQKTFIYSLNTSNAKISKIRFNDDDKTNLIDTNTNNAYISVNHTTGILNSIPYYFVLRYHSAVDILALEYYNMIDNTKYLKLLYDEDDDSKLSFNDIKNIILKVEENRLFILGIGNSIVGVIDYNKLNITDSKIKVSMLALIPAQNIIYTDVFYDSNISIYRFYGQNKPLLVSYSFNNLKVSMVPLANTVNHKILKVIKHSITSSCIVIVANGVNHTVEATKLTENNTIGVYKILDNVDWYDLPFGFAVIGNKYLILQTELGFISFNSQFNMVSSIAEENDIEMFLLNEYYGIYGKRMDQYNINFGILAISDGSVEVEGLEYFVEYPNEYLYPFISNI